ncbi:MAG TPA: hypothetical protein DGT23_06130 [Micromonosporaceae bacterium]|nr:hypothetical protein [Micromonosporaceae bacterium]
MHVREARREDNEALVALAAQCPMNGDLSICVDRHPDFFALSQLAGDPLRIGVIDGEQGPIACVGVARRQVYLDRRPSQLAYLGDLKVHPAHRRQGAGRALAKWAIATARDLAGDDTPLLATVLAGNNAVTSLQRDVPGVLRRATVRSHSISLLWKRRLPQTELTVRPAVLADAPDMAALWRQLASPRQFAPIHESFPILTPGLDYLLAHHPNGELAGFVGLWDQHRIKQMRVTGYSPRLATARVAFNVVAPLFRAPMLPSPGGALNYRTVVNPCAPDSQTLRTLLLHACHQLRGRYSFLTIGLDTRDPLSQALAGMLAQPTDVDVLVLGEPPGSAIPVHIEIATV